MSADLGTNDSRVCQIQYVNLSTSERHNLREKRLLAKWRLHQNVAKPNYAAKSAWSTKRAIPRAAVLTLKETEPSWLTTPSSLQVA